MKRAFAIFFIALANIAILAHAVVPHHHHNKVFAAVVNLIDEDSRAAFLHEHSLDSHHDGAVATHHHDTTSSHHHNGGNEECLINEACSAAIRIQKHLYDGDADFALSLANFYLDLAVAIMPDILSADTSTQSVKYEYVPHSTGCHLDFIARATGLRAPPVC